MRIYKERRQGVNFQFKKQDADLLLGSIMKVEESGSSIAGCDFCDSYNCGGSFPNCPIFNYTGEISCFGTPYWPKNVEELILFGYMLLDFYGYEVYEKKNGKWIKMRIDLKKMEAIKNKYPGKVG